MKKAKMYKCHKCETITPEYDLAEVDDGCYEEFWGAKVWHSVYTDVCPKCFSEDIEETDDEDCD